MKVWEVYNRKGGVAKTTTVANVASVLAMQGKRVCVIDCDDQRNLSIAFGRRTASPTIYEVLMEDASPALYPTLVENLVLIPGSEDTGAIDSEIDRRVRDTFRADPSRNILDFDPDELRGEFLLPRVKALIDRLARHEFDYVIFDVPAAWSTLVNVTTMLSDTLIVPVQCEFFATEGAEQTENLIRDIREQTQLDVRILLTMANAQWNHTAAQASKIGERFGASVLRTAIKRSIVCSEANEAGLPLVAYNPRAEAALNYVNAVWEITADQTRRNTPGISPTTLDQDPNAALPQAVAALADA